MLQSPSSSCVARVVCYMYVVEPDDSRASRATGGCAGGLFLSPASSNDSWIPAASPILSLGGVFLVRPPRM